MHFVYIFTHITVTWNMQNSKTDMDKFQTMLEDTKYELEDTQDVDAMWNHFESRLHQAISDCVPTKQKTVRRDCKPACLDKASDKAT